MPRTYLDKLCERWICALLLLEFIFAIQWDVVTEDVGDSFDDSIRLLTLVQCVAQARVDGDHVVDIPKQLLDKVCATVFWDDIRRAQRRYPNLYLSLARTLSESER